MPKVSSFFGIEIHIYWRDHGPPHFHAIYSDHEASISIESRRILAGRLPPRVMGMVVEWAVQHRSELEQATKLEPLGRIEPLR